MRNTRLFWLAWHSQLCQKKRHSSVDRTDPDLSNDPSLFSFSLSPPLTSPWGPLTITTTTLWTTSHLLSLSLSWIHPGGLKRAVLCFGSDTIAPRDQVSGLLYYLSRPQATWICFCSRTLTTRSHNFPTLIGNILEDHTGRLAFSSREHDFRTFAFNAHNLVELCVTKQS